MTEEYLHLFKELDIHLSMSLPGYETFQEHTGVGNVGTEIPYCAIKDPSKYKHIHFGFQCAAAKGFFVIDPSGKIRACNHSPHIVGHIFGKPMIEDVDYWNLFAHSEYKPKICSSCTMVQMCDCGCREVANILYGNPREKDPSIIE